MPSISSMGMSKEKTCLSHARSSSATNESRPRSTNGQVVLSSSCGLRSRSKSFLPISRAKSFDASVDLRIEGSALALFNYVFRASAEAAAALLTVLL